MSTGMGRSPVREDSDDDGSRPCCRHHMVNDMLNSSMPSDTDPNPPPSLFCLCLLCESRHGQVWKEIEGSKWHQKAWHWNSGKVAPFLVCHHVCNFCSSPPQSDPLGRLRGHVQQSLELTSPLQANDQLPVAGTSPKEHGAGPFRERPSPRPEIPRTRIPCPCSLHAADEQNTFLAPFASSPGPCRASFRRPRR